MSGLTTSGSAASGLGATDSEPIVEREPHSTDAEGADRLLESPLETSLETRMVDQNADSWRAEVAARLERYRTRRKPRTPRYPSLMLPFDSPESWSRPAPAAGSAVVTTAAVSADADFEPSRANLHTTQTEETAPETVFAEARPERGHAHSELSAKVIEFPRSAVIPVVRVSTLADPVFDFDRPRIVEAPAILPPPPALGGMLIEPLRQEPVEHADSAFQVPIASIARRLMAGTADGVVVVLFLALFCAVVFRLNPVREPLLLLAGTAFIVGVVLWVAYSFLFVVYTGSSPGLRVARLQLARFDGKPLDRRRRRWRALASCLSAFSVGLGYAWCVLDQDKLCWHDRITRTCVTPMAIAENSSLENF